MKNIHQDVHQVYLIYVHILSAHGSPISSKRAVLQWGPASMTVVSVSGYQVDM